MKKITINNVLTILVAATIFIVSCTKEKTEVTLDPKLATSQLLNIKSDSATIVGFVVAAGIGFTEKGVCYNTAPAPTIDNHKVVFSSENAQATFSVRVGGLSYATKYYARAYATNANGTIYGDEMSFTTLPVVPTLTTAAISAITGNSAMGGGSVTVAGGADVTKRGICYGINHNPTTKDSKTEDNTGTGDFVSSLTKLKGNTVYYVRAYAINTAGTGYGPEVTFTTLVDLPVVTTTSVSAITKTSATSGGEVSYDGGGTVKARGLAWGLTANPTTSSNIIAGGTGTGTFVSNLTGLSLFTTYHVRAYATNSAGTAYGSDVQFTTLANTQTWYIPGDYVAASYPGSSYADWSPDKSPQIKSTVTAPDELEGYVYMANTTNNWKFASQPNWGGPNYADNDASGNAEPGVLDPNAKNNISSGKGYYKLNANSATMKFTAIATSWGVIGDATPGGWGDETAMTYNPSSATWTGVFHFTVAAFKFRANHSWDYNYGSDKADGTLSAGGGNIPVTVESDYAVTLDLSHPNAYTYSANRWGVIGDATAGGWDNDTNMTWDAVNNVFTVTMNLTSTGAFKFRANDGWDVNLGGSLGALTAGGDNLKVDTSGSYTITMNPWTKMATITKN